MHDRLCVTRLCVQGESLRRTALHSEGYGRVFLRDPVLHRGEPTTAHLLGFLYSSQTFSGLINNETLIVFGLK